MVFIDLQKTFGVINHKILIKKMSSVGFSAQWVAWFESYLSDRRFQVNIKNKFSSVAYINCRVPRGSISGSLFFPIYVNDMFQAVDGDLLLYADDPRLV